MFKVFLYPRNGSRSIKFNAKTLNKAMNHISKCTVSNSKYIAADLLMDNQVILVVDGRKIELIEHREKASPAKLYNYTKWQMDPPLKKKKPAEKYPTPFVGNTVEYTYTDCPDEHDKILEEEYKADFPSEDELIQQHKTVKSVRVELPSISKEMEEKGKEINEAMRRLNDKLKSVGKKAKLDIFEY